MTAFLLKIVSLFRSFYTASGVDFDQLQAILTVKLTMDNRRNNAALARGWGHQKESNNRFLGVLFIYGLLGAFLCVFIALVPDFLLISSLLHGYILMMMCLTLVSDFSAVLLDTADNVIILPRPVDGKTLFMARMTHIVLYLGQILLALTLIPVLFLSIKFGVWAGITLFLTGVLTVFLAVFITSCIYLVIMRFANEEKMRDIINTFQILMTVVFFSLYQILPRFVDFDSLENSQFVPTLQHLAIPPVWFGGLMNTLVNGSFGTIQQALCLLAIAVPMGGLWLLSRYFSNFFNRKLANLGNDIRKIEKNTPSVKMGFWTKISEKITQNPVERAAFELVGWQLGRDRKLKLQLYPQLAYAPVLLVVTMLPLIKDGLGSLRDTQFYLFYIYFMGGMLNASLSLTPYSEDFKAAWVYYALPVERPGDVLLGSLKAQFIAFFVPFFLFLSVFIIGIWGFSTLGDLILGGLNCLVLTLLSATLTNKYLPFSMAQTDSASTGNAGRGLLLFFMAAFVGGIHYLIVITLPFLIWVLIPAVLFALVVLVKKYRQTTWKELNESDRF
jgi:ABC-2 type transport system permease protein